MTECSLFVTCSEMEKIKVSGNLTESSCPLCLILLRNCLKFIFVQVVIDLRTEKLRYFISFVINYQIYIQIDYFEKNLDVFYANG